MHNRIDFFISYTKEDRNWAEWIAWVLEDAGYKVKIQRWDFRPGMDFVEEMEGGIKEAKHTLAILSPQYINSTYATAEWRAAWAEDVNGKQRKLIPIKVEKCNIEGFLKTRIYIDFVDKEKEAAKQALFNGINVTRSKPPSEPDFPSKREKALEDEPAFPGALPSIWNIPTRRNPNFVGRQELLTHLRKVLTTGGHVAALTQAVTGLGGVGKTQLALEYCYRNYATYDIVWWIRAEETATLASDYAALAVQLNLPEKNIEKKSDIIKAVRRWLELHGNWLLIFDNVIEPRHIKDYLPQAEIGHAIITSRFRHWQDYASEIELKVWKEDEAVTYLIRVIGRSEEKHKEKAKTVAEILGYLPLALAQAAAYIKETGCSFDEYIELVQKRQRELWRAEEPPNFYRSTVDITWKISMDAVLKQEQSSAYLLNIFAYLAPDNIPKDLIKSGKKFYHKSLQNVVDDSIIFNRAIKYLGRYSMIDVHIESYSIHKLVQAVVRDNLSNEDKKLWTKTAVNLMIYAMSKGANNPRSWPIRDMMLPHALAAVEHSEVSGILIKETLILFREIGGYQAIRALYAESEKILTRGLAFSEKYFGKSHPYTVVDLGDLALTYLDLGKYDEAEQLLKRAIEIVEKNQRSDYINFPITLCNLAKLYQIQGNYGEAEGLIEEALQFRKSHLKPNAPEISDTLILQGDLYHTQGKFEQAEKSLKEALDIRQKYLNPEHPDIAESLHFLARVYSRQYSSQIEMESSLRGFGLSEAANEARSKAKHKYQQSITLFGQSLKIREKTLGSDHIEVAKTLNNLAMLYKSYGKCGLSEAVYQRVLKIDEKHYGTNHPVVATDYNNLGMLYESLGKYDKAEPLYNKVKEIRLNVFGENHPETGQIYGDLGIFYLVKGDLSAANNYIEQAIGICTTTLGREHKKTKSLLRIIDTLQSKDANAINQLQEGYRDDLGAKCKPSVSTI